MYVVKRCLKQVPRDSFGALFSAADYDIKLSFSYKKVTYYFYLFLGISMARCLYSSQ